MLDRIAISAFLALTLPCRVWSQGAPETAGSPPPTPPPGEREVSWGKLIPNIARDQAAIFTSPARLTRNRNWVPFVAFAAVTAGLVAADPHVGHYFRNTTSYSGFNTVFNSNATAIGTAAVPAVTYVAGLLGKDSYAKNTALLTAEALADAEIATAALKIAIPRSRPSSIPPSGDFGDTWFEGRSSGWGTGGSFPSGHASAAFAVATVVARRYGKRHPWVPYVAYGMAATVGFSRLTLSAHFPSDVFAGAALGYAIGRFAVLRQ